MTTFHAPDLGLWLAVYRGEIGIGRTPQEAQAEARRVADRKARPMVPEDEQARKRALAMDWAGANLQRR